MKNSTVNSTKNPSINPLDYDLPSRTILEASGKNNIYIVINRKSRLIMADANKILDKVLKIKAKNRKLNVGVKTNAPVCSKSIEFYKNNNISILPI